MKKITVLNIVKEKSESKSQPNKGDAAVYWTVLNIVKEKSESKSQQKNFYNSGSNDCFKYCQRKI